GRRRRPGSAGRRAGQRCPPAAGASARAGPGSARGGGGGAAGAGRRRGAEALALLALVAAQDVEPVEGSDGTDGRWRIARQVAADRVISTVDPDTRHVHKTVHRRQDGFKAHVAIEPDTGIITDCALRQASGTDNHEAVVGMALLAD